jgi:hypothetical protein
MPRELSPFELDRELRKVAPRARAVHRALATGRDVTLSVPEVLADPETLERLASDKSDPIAPALVRHLYWLSLMQRSLPTAGERVRRYRIERHALDAPLSGHFTWRELLGHALRDAPRRPALLDVLFERGGALRDSVVRAAELRAQTARFCGKSRPELELPNPDIAEQARAFLLASSDACQSLGARALSDVLELGLAPGAADGWPRQLSLRSLHELIGNAAWLSGLRLELGQLPAPISAASFVRGLLRLGAAWYEALAPSEQPYAIAHDPFGLGRAEHGAILAGLTSSDAFARRQLGLGRERALGHVRALARSALLFARQLAFRVLQAEPILQGSGALAEAFSEYGALAFGFELPPHGAGLLFRPRLGDAQKLAGVWLAAGRADSLLEEHDEDWYRNPRAIEQLRAEARLSPATTASSEALQHGAKRFLSRVTERL